MQQNVMHGAHFPWRLLDSTSRGSGGDSHAHEARFSRLCETALHWTRPGEPLTGDAVGSAGLSSPGAKNTPFMP